MHFTAAPGTTALLPGADGRLAGVLLGVSALDDVWAYGGLPMSLPEGSYRLDGDLDRDTATRAALGWALGSYAFTRYRKLERTFATLVWPKGCDRTAVERAATATYLVRDLVNTPAADLGPAELAAAAEDLAEQFSAKCRVIVGDDLLRKGYPAIHAVGRASVREPRLIDLSWGAKSDPRVTIVGKGVCFDSGGLDLKPSSNMLLMKKDMGGGAHALGLARMVMMAGLPVRLRVLIPAVENAVSGDAMRPLDVLATRKGLTVEVGNTDAEGRLILCDALAEADSENPELIVDFATLTGAARVALGPELPALFCNDDRLAAELIACGQDCADPLWRMPLWQPYRKGLESKVADLNNVTSGSFAGSITAALFLESFVSRGSRWAHLDIMAWNVAANPGRPEGGEATGMRAVYALIERRFGGKPAKRAKGA
jgi:leucyl aminopeptidase